MNGQSKLKIFLAFAAVYIIWGSTYVVVIICLRSIPPFVMTAFRFLVAGVMLYLWSRFSGEARPRSQSLRRNIIAGILMLFGGTVSVAWAEQYLSSSLAAIIVTSVPFWFILLDKKQWSFYLKNKIIFAGLLLGAAGVCILVGFNESHTNATQLVGMNVYAVFVIIAGGIAFTIGSLYSKYNPANDSVIMNGSIQLISAGLFTLMVSIISGEWDSYRFSNTGTNEWSGLLYLIVMGSVVTYISYLWLLKIRPAAQVTTYVYVNPVVAVLLGALIANEQITWLQIIALVIILSGVLIVNRVRYKAALELRS